VRILLIGSGGQVGSDLCRLLASDGRPASWAGLSRTECDVTDPDRVRAVIIDHSRRAKAQGGLVVINAAAWTDVDGAEAQEVAAYAANAAGPAHVAAACSEVRARLVHISTDYVFDGSAMRPYEVDDHPEPTSAYGRSKLAGEQALLAICPWSYVVRTSWVYGAVGKNFVKTMARLAAQQETVGVVDDQRGSPTWSADLARALLELALSNAAHGIYHYTNGGEVTWCEFAQAIMKELGEDPAKVRPIATSEYPQPASRPAYSVLSARRWVDAGLPPPRSWREALSAAFAAHSEELRGPLVAKRPRVDQNVN
jgi:dTDP-4-dehydrorhamnose reductase